MLEFAYAQDGVVAHSQVRQLGLSASAIQRLVSSGRWVRLHHGVYSVAPTSVTIRAEVWAAVLYAGAGAAASHETAAWLDGFAEPPAILDVTVPRPRQHRGLERVRFHRSTMIEARRHPTRQPPRTRVEETVLDLCDRAMRLDGMVATVMRACRERLTTPDRIRLAATRRPRLRWRAELAIVLRDVEAGAHTLLERRYLDTVERAHGLPRGKRQLAVRRGSRTEYKDVYYDDPYHVVVELDGPVGHSADLDRFRDMARDNADTLDGRLVLRYGFRDVERDPCRVASQVARALRQRGWLGSPRRCGPTCALHDLVI